MDTDEALLSGANRNELDETELRVHGGATDPLWYLIAKDEAPHMAHSRMRDWQEGFVAALEAVRGIDADPGVTQVLKDSVGLVMEVPVATRRPFPVKADEESLGRWMFDREAKNNFTEGEVFDAEEAWKDPGVREYYVAEARAILRFLP